LLASIACYLTGKGLTQLLAIINFKKRIGISNNYLIKQDEDILVMNYITFRIPILEDEDTGNKFY